MPTKYKTVDELNFALNNMNIADIRAIARDFGVVPRNRKRGDLIDAILAMCCVLCRDSCRSPVCRR